MINRFKVGDRVALKGHWEFPDGTSGTIVMPREIQITLAQDGEWKGHIRTVEGCNGPINFYFVQFDNLTDDGSGDGPYSAAEIDEDSLVPYA